MLGELIQSLWSSIKGNTEVKKSTDLQSTSDGAFQSIGLPQGEAYLRYRENKLTRGEVHIQMLTENMKTDK